MTHRGLAAELPVVLAAVPEVSAGLVTVARLAQGLLDHTPAGPEDDQHVTMMIMTSYVLTCEGSKG